MSIKELQAKVDDLERRVEALENPKRAMMAREGDREMVSPQNYGQICAVKGCNNAARIVLQGQFRCAEHSMPDAA